MSGLRLSECTSSNKIISIKIIKRSTMQNVNKRGKTITTYLLNGNPRGIKTAFISNRICHCMAIPRPHLQSAKTRKELATPSLYLLFGDDNTVYVGETENFLERIEDHHRKKDFWNEAVVFFVKEGSLTKADVQLLEHLSLSRINEANLYTLEENRQKANAPQLPEHQRDTVLDFFDDVQILASFLGYPLFDKAQTNTSTMFFCKGTLGTDAKAIYVDKMIRVLAGSKIRKETSGSYNNVSERLVKLNRSGIEKPEYYELIQDIEFSSPSQASSFCLGRNSNGWRVWVNQEGKSLHDVHRVLKKEVPN